MTVQVVDHPLVASAVSSLRDRRTPAAEFRRLTKSISSMLCYEASKTLATAPVEGLESPIAPYTGTQVAPRVGLSPILRAGIGMTDAALDLFPDASVFYLGLFREKVSLQPVEYYQKLPPSPTVDVIYVLDPLIATGGTAIAAVSMLVDWGMPIESIKLIGLLGSKAGVDAVAAACPGLDVFVGAVDEQLSGEGMIVPGIGDSGDRLFSTFA